MLHLYSTLSGSKLYGTSTPTSDRDIKHVVLPNFNDLLLGKPIKNTFKKTNTAKNVRNSADDVDEEFIPLHVFARDFMKGQTYALELAFSVDGTHAEQIVHSLPQDTETKSLFALFVEELRSRFLTSDIKAMMGYVVNQASLYSFKGERLNACRELLESLAGFAETNQLIDYEAEIANYVQPLVEKYPKYVKLTDYDIGTGVMRPCIKLLEKTLPLTNTVSHTRMVIETLMKKYGSRAEEASASNVDWKATMHAIRIVDEGLKLLAEHQLEFPFAQPYVDRLLSIKRGEVDIAEITVELSTKLDLLKELEQTTTLPAYTLAMHEDFDLFMLKWLHKFYDLS